MEQVEVFTYLGTEIDRNLSFTQQVNSVYKKAQQRLSLLRRLKGFNVRQDILTAVYQSLVESVISFNIVSWFNFLSAVNEGKLSRVIKQASKMIGYPQTQLLDLYNCAVQRKAAFIVTDPSHPLHSFFQLLPPGHYFTTPFARRKAYSNYFIPTAISILNKAKQFCQEFVS